MQTYLSFSVYLFVFNNCPFLAIDFDFALGPAIEGF